MHTKISTNLKLLTTKVDAACEYATKTATDTKNKVETVNERWLRFNDMYRGFEEKLQIFEAGEIKLRNDFQELMANSNKALLIKLNVANQRMDEWHGKIEAHKKRIANQLTRIDHFGAEILENRQKIEANSGLARRTEQMVKDFKSDDVYAKSEDCFRYFQVKLFKFREHFETDVKPQIEKAVMDQRDFTKRHQFQKLEHEHKHTKHHVKDLIEQLILLKNANEKLQARCAFIEEHSREVRQAMGGEAESDDPV